LRDSAGFAPDFAVSAPAGAYVPGAPSIAPARTAQRSGLQDVGDVTGAFARSPRRVSTLTQTTVLPPPVHYATRRGVACGVCGAEPGRGNRSTGERLSRPLEGAKPARRGLHLLSPLFGSGTAPAPVTSLRLLVFEEHAAALDTPHGGQATSANSRRRPVPSALTTNSAERKSPRFDATKATRLSVGFHVADRMSSDVPVCVSRLGRE
jgi:hypothetical protein